MDAAPPPPKLIARAAEVADGNRNQPFTVGFSIQNHSDATRVAANVAREYTSRDFVVERAEANLVGGAANAKSSVIRFPITDVLDQILEEKQPLFWRRWREGQRRFNEFIVVKVVVGTIKTEGIKKIAAHARSSVNGRRFQMNADILSTISGPASWSSAFSGQR